MRRLLLCTLLLALLCAPGALAQQVNWEPIMAEVETVGQKGLSESVLFDEAGDWVAVEVTQRGMVAPRLEGTQLYGLVFVSETGERVTWEDVFADPDAAAQAIAEKIEALAADNAYSERNEVEPVPRDSFTINETIFTVYYPAEQLSYFSGLSGAFSFYAYELGGLLAEGVPLAEGDLSQAADAVRHAVTEGVLPGPFDPWVLGLPMADAAKALSLVDVPDLTDTHAIWRFEASYMQGAALLSARDDTDVDTATITGVMTDRMDFTGMQTGVTTMEACMEALSGVEGLRAEPEALVIPGEAATLMLSFTQGVLSRITLTR